MTSVTPYRSSLNRGTLLAHMDYLAGARHFITEAVSALAQDVSLVVPLPSGMAADDLRVLLDNALFEREMRVYAVALDQLPPDHPEPLALFEALQIGSSGGEPCANDPPPHSADGLRCRADLPDVVFLSGFERLSFEAVGRWLRFASAWAWASKRHSNPKACALCLAVPACALDALPTSDVERLDVRPWWGVPSALEVAVLCRALDSEPGATARWREHLLPSVCGADLALAERLWDGLEADMDTVTETLVAIGRERNWSEERLDLWGLTKFLRLPFLRADATAQTTRPPEHLYRLWAEGVIHWTPEWGLEASTAALALTGHGDVLRHRLWRGQAAACLPPVDAVRNAACARLIHRERWDCLRSQGHLPIDDNERAAVIASPWRCELGYLDHLARWIPAAQFEDDLREAIALAKYIRNKIAHYQLVSFGDFEELLLRLSALGQNGDTN